MTSVIVQPCGAGVPRQHFDDTIEQLVRFNDHADLIGRRDRDALEVAFPSGAAAMWGVVLGVGGVNVAKYNRVRVGDLVMFSGDKRFFACGTVGYLLHNEAFADALWSRDATGQTWEYMYALDEIRPLDVPYTEFNAAVGDSPKNNHMGFRVLNEQASEALLEHLPLASERHVPAVSPDDYESAVRELVGDLDRTYQANRRTEQSYLRARLFTTATSACDLCGREFEVEFLVAAHIKKRASCTDDERRDAQHVVMSACKFGCDELFERGYISVAPTGQIVLSSALKAGTHALAYASLHLTGRAFGGNLSGREQYFTWHHQSAFRG